MAIRGARAAGLSFLTLAEPEQMAVDAGINLFELRKVELSFSNPKDFGLWDVKVRLRTGMNSNQQTYQIDWQQGMSAYVSYRANSKGVCVGFCPDDPLWHNRIILSAIPETITKLDRYHTRNGVINGAMVRQEIDILGDYIHDWQLVDNDDEIEGRKVLARSKNKEELEDSLRKLIRANPSKKAQYQIVRAKIATIEQLIAIHSGDWFACDEFQHEIRPVIQSCITELTSSNVVSETASNLLASVQTMTPAQRQELRELLFPSTEPVTGLVTENFDVSNTIESNNIDNTTDRTEYTTLGINELRSQAAKLGIPHIGRKKAELLDDIRTALTQKALSATPPIAVEETGATDEYAENDETEEVFN